jgi:hypothetical protein
LESVPRQSSDQAMSISPYHPYDKPWDEMEACELCKTDLEWSSVTNTTRLAVFSNALDRAKLKKMRIFCGYEYCGGLSSISPSASPCEHSWSIEAWIQNKKRNRLGQKNVERLLRCRTNITLEKLFALGIEVLPWELDVIIEEPGEDEEDE